MPLTPELRQKVEQIRDYLYGGGYPDPVSNAEQLSFLFFFYLAETLDAQNQTRARVAKQPYESIFAGEWTLRNPLNAPAFGGATAIPVTSSAGPRGPGDSLVKTWCASSATRCLPFSPKSPSVPPSTS